MARREAAAPVLLLAVLGCGSSGETVRLPLPIELEPDAQAALLAFRVDGGPRTLHLIDLANLDPAALELPFVRPYETGTVVEAVLLFYAAPPSGLGLTPGPIPVRSSGGTELRYFAPEKLMSGRRLRLHSGETPNWESVGGSGGLDEGLLSTRIDFDPCIEFRPTNAKVVGCRHPVVVLPRGKNRVMFGTAGQRFWDLDVSDRNRLEPVRVPGPLIPEIRPPATDQLCATEGTTSTSTVMVPLEQRIFGGVGSMEDHAWFGGWGAVHYVRPGAAAVRVDLPLPPTTVRHRSIRWLAGQHNPDREDFELYAMTGRGTLFRVLREGSVFQAELVYDFGIADDLDVLDYGGLAYPGLGRVVAVLGSKDNVLFYDHSRAEAERVSDDRRPYPGQGFSAAVFVPEIGSLIAGEGARILRHEEGDNSWVPLEVTSDWQARIEALGVYGDGFLFGGTNGFIAQYARGPGFCPTRQLAPHTPRYFVPLQDAVFVIGAKPSDRNEVVFSVLGYD